MELRFNELTDRQQDQARAMFIDAGTVRDNYWYYVDACGSVMCRNKVSQSPFEHHVEDEGLDNN